METRTYTVYKFDELSDEGKEKAIRNLCDINVNYEWWDSIYEDAKTIGLEIRSFDLDRNKHVAGELTMRPENVISAILSNHGTDCETTKFAKEQVKIFATLNMDTDAYDEAEQEFLRALCEEYASILQNECDYLMGDEAIIETIRANEYDFTSEGQID